MQTLDPIRLPLNGVSLIEASAGTGKTYTMVSLYLRLLLQVGENPFPVPLGVENILVVTFTEAATEELKKKIRERVSQVKQALIQYQQEKDVSSYDPFLVELIHQIQDIDLAIQRLVLAEQNMDIAAIYTIHGFCRRILTQYAFNSGIHFDLELSKDQTALYQQLANQYWREHYYPLSPVASQFVYQQLVSPAQVVQQLKPYLSGARLNPSINQPHLLTLPFEQFIQQYIEASQANIVQLKQQWLADQAEIKTLVFTELQKSYKKGEPKRLKRTSFRANNVENWFANIEAWASSDEQNLPSHLCKYFSQQALIQQYCDEGAEPLTHPLFEKIDEINQQVEQYPLYTKILLWHYLCWLREQLAKYKVNHKQKNFDDLLTLLNHALYGEQGEAFASLIHQQYPFAMIDEFQDTDRIQYDIFAKIYLQSAQKQNGFIMIGDPKQAIYKFRGADIFTYLFAAEQTSQRFSLNKNWRSDVAVVETVNQLFNFHQPHSSFLYDKIRFEPVQAQQRLKFQLDQQEQPPLLCYIQEKNDKAESACICAKSIQQWLALSEKKSATLNGEPIQARNIAVLVRNWQEAALIKNALAELKLPSVYLSDNQNVFDSKEAEELALILTACLNPFNERAILNAISTALFALDSAKIYQVRQDEKSWQSRLERFVNYQRIWQYQGVLAMLHHLLLKEEIPQKLMQQKNAERRLTDILHLAELLQQASVLHESNGALLRWFEDQILGKDRQEEQQIRLESERDLIKIVTFHKSKGLEYDLVWLPFLAEAMKMPSGKIQTYYDEHQQQICWDMDLQHQDAIRYEAMAEELRLLYVALTRAKYQLVMSLPQEFTPKQGWNAFLYVLTQGKIGTEKTLSEPLNTKAFLSRFCDEQAILTPEIFAPMESPQKQQQAELPMREFCGQIERNWQISSFTALNYQQQKKQSAVENQNIFFDDAQDHDLHFSDKPQQLLEENSDINNDEHYPAGYSPFDFPMGMQVGVALHRYFELAQFQQGVDQALIEQLCQQLQLDPQWQQPIQQWFEAVIHTPLVKGTNLTFAQITPTQMLREWQFYLKLGKPFNLHKFNQVLAQYHRPRSDFQFEAVQGMLRGFIDLVFCHQQQYYIVDYKSNYLGSSPQDYQQDKLQEYMLSANYDLQYLIYSLALHRYLRQRDPHYQYEKHFGGVIYTFIRGMNGTNTEYGVYFDKPDVALIEQLDQLF
ncbi:DNA helicase/exodeoxyribonuclease V beta subunit [Volucribacter psittacicida]|uniref:RecBCD enzyme subunit RecB n=1 Tax=Volucribacter psittacicida TaxID=203482 RepID=A0A4R1G2D5_9PAST|nr:exodeoxyribonuclease V subunit beta [Volucribacter psittacicida]TCK01884.1 DNA helicase/exodeoxyribonuclease V beta subunit [Volucribacter psittacicida]